MQRVKVEFAQQVVTGNQRDREQQQGDRQANGLTVFAQSIKQAQALGIDRLCCCDSVL